MKMAKKKKNQYCEIHNSIRASLDLSCKDEKQTQQSNKESQPAESPVCYQQDDFTFGGQYFILIFFFF